MNKREKELFLESAEYDTQLTLYCDRCGLDDHVNGNPEDCVEVMYDEGWRIYEPGVLLCPICDIKYKSGKEPIDDIIEEIKWKDADY